MLLLVAILLGTVDEEAHPPHRPNILEKERLRSAAPVSPAPTPPPAPQRRAVGTAQDAEAQGGEAPAGRLSPRSGSRTSQAAGDIGETTSGARRDAAAAAPGVESAETERRSCGGEPPPAAKPIDTDALLAGLKKFRFISRNPIRTSKMLNTFVEHLAAEIFTRRNIQVATTSSNVMELDVKASSDADSFTVVLTAELKCRAPDGKVVTAWKKSKQIVDLHRGRQDHGRHQDPHEGRHDHVFQTVL